VYSVEKACRCNRGAGALEASLVGANEGGAVMIRYMGLGLEIGPGRPEQPCDVDVFQHHRELEPRNMVTTN